MTPTRPLYAPYRAILFRLSELGPSPRDALISDPSLRIHLHRLVELRYARTEIDTDYHGGKGGKHYVYTLTELGRSVLASGVVPANRRAYNRTFTATKPPRGETVKREGCCHHWMIVHPTWTCQRCSEVKTVWSSFAAGQGVVGGGSVRKSERYQSFARVQGLDDTERYTGVGG